MPQTVHAFLDKSDKAKQLLNMDFGAGRHISIWENAFDRVHYDAPIGHAFSRYLAGGQGTRRIDIEERVGWPGAVCVLPEGHQSKWEINDPFRFVHLYVPDDKLRGHFARTHDCDSRLLEVHELTLEDVPLLSAPLAAMARAAINDNILQADTAFAELIAKLKPSKLSVNGGLAPHHLRRIDEWIEAHIEGTIRLKELAALIDLSEFHFHRMFRASRGISPHTWIMARRIARAKDMLQDHAIARIAAACGFSSQSHFTRAFKAETGMTPAAYRQKLT